MTLQEILKAKGLDDKLCLVLKCSVLHLTFEDGYEKSILADASIKNDIISCLSAFQAV